MEIRFEKLRDIPVGRISGDIDVANTAEIEQSIVDNVPNSAFGFVLDLTEVEYLDSAGIRLLFQLETRLEGRQVKLVILLPKDSPVNRTLDAVGAGDALCVCRTIEDSLVEIERSTQPPTD